MSFKDTALEALTDLSREMFAPNDEDTDAAQKVFNATVAAMQLGATTDEVRDALAVGLAAARMEGL